MTLTLCVFIDAFGWELLRRRSFLPEHIVRRTPLGTQFGYSCTCDPTLLTGCLPREHGHFSFYAFDPERSPFRDPLIAAIGRLPAALTGRGRIRSRLSGVVRRRLGYTGYFALYGVPFHRLPSLDYTEKRDLYEPGGILGGQPTVFDYLRAQKIPFHRSDWRGSDAANVTALSRSLERDRPRFAYLYWAGLDALLHAEGTGGARVEARIRWYESALRELLGQATARYSEVRLHLFSDHGMTDVTHRCDLMARIERLGLTWGRDYAAIFDSTMARFYFATPQAEATVRAALDRVPEGRVLSESTLAEWGCDFPDRRYGHLFFLLDPGVLLCPSDMGSAPLAGMHGYDPSHPDSVASYQTNTLDSPLPCHLKDLYRLMLDDAGRVS